MSMVCVYKCELLINRSGEAPRSSSGVRSRLIPEMRPCASSSMLSLSTSGKLCDASETSAGFVLLSYSRRKDQCILK